MLVRNMNNNYILGLAVDLSSCVKCIMCSITAVEPSTNKILIDVGVGVVSSMWKLKFLSPAAGCESFVAYMRQ